MVNRLILSQFLVYSLFQLTLGEKLLLQNKWILNDILKQNKRK